MKKTKTCRREEFESTHPENEEGTDTASRSGGPTRHQGSSTRISGFDPDVNWDTVKGGDEEN